MKLVTSVTALLLLAGCQNDIGVDEVALAEAHARTAEAEARTAEARAAEAAARKSAVTELAPAAPHQPRQVVAEPMVDYEPFSQPRPAYVQTQSDGQITLRSEPRANGRRVIQVVDGTRVAVLGCQTEARVRTDAVAAGTPGRWCFVRTGDHDGWAFDAYLVYS